MLICIFIDFMIVIPYHSLADAVANIYFHQMTKFITSRPFTAQWLENWRDNISINVHDTICKYVLSVVISFIFVHRFNRIEIR